MKHEWTFTVSGFINDESKHLNVSLYGYPWSQNEEGHSWRVPVQLPDSEPAPTPEWVREILISLIENL